ncbi:proton-coupled amino acid transporter-like protein pathetic [Phymastichus coffea]|uniref:proton-coupled amino acid transporter-like protein pathetic n=1 Tax=Phymastichus coffea TaxID=108790 RepID=UPI00273AD9C3|nr:proton-coupled amino acid transporter-like protein pathetic [Phymastichus coffea]
MHKIQGSVRNDETDDYDPVKYRPSEQITSTTFATFMHLLKAAIGSGILFLPYAFRKTGYIAAITCSILVGSISIHTAVLTVQCSQILCKRARIPSLNFAETAEVSFGLGPEPFRKYANAFGVATNVIVCFVQYETAVVYALYIASSLQQVIEYFADAHVDVRWYLMALIPIFIAFSLVPNFRYLVPFSVMGAVFLFFGFCLTFYYLLSDFPSPSRLETYTDYEQLAIYCGVFLFAVHNMSILLPLENSMIHPSMMPVVLGSSMIVNVCIYILFGFLGYNKYPDACDTVIMNLPLNELPAQMVKVSIVLSVLCTYGLQYYVPITILWPMIAKKIGDNICYERCFRIGGVIICTLLAIALPHMASLLGLFAAISMTTVMLLIPILIEIATKWNYLTGCKGRIMIIKNIVISIVWLMLLIFGTLENINSIIRQKSGDEPVTSDMCSTS